MKNNEQSVKEVLEVMDKWHSALQEKDTEAMHKNYDSECYCLFDVQATAKSVDESKKLWEAGFPFFDKPKLEYKDIVVNATDDMAVVHFKSKMTGFKQPVSKDVENTWIRGTIVYKKVEGEWTCIHEHISYPVNCETMTIAQEV